MADAPPSVDVELENLIRARYPLIYIVSWEEKRVEESIREVCQRRGKKMVVWTFTTGMAGNLASKDPIAALDYVINAPDQTVFVLKDFHPFIGDVAVTRRLRDLVYALKQSYKTVVLLSPLLKLPPELEKEITVVDYQLPTIQDLDRLLESIIQSVRGDTRINVNLTSLEREQVLKSASGLTSIEAENVFAKSLVEKRRFDIDVILGEKEQIIRKSGILEYFRASDSFADVGGMDLLKNWMEQRTTSFNEDAKKYGLPEPKGILLLGVQGCGKSLIAKSIASLWRIPLLRLDVGKIFAGIVGSSEENMRKAIATAESVSPCILWLDELEKGFAGTQSSPFSDGGTTSRVFGTFITWLQDKKAACFVVATSNDVSQLPPELMRKGRFDEIFFVDLPALPERQEIFNIHLRKRGRDVLKFDTQNLARLAAGYSGAEIEQVVVAALFSAYSDGKREVGDEDMVQAMRDSVPLSVTMQEGIQKLRDWAETRARPSSSTTVEPMHEWQETLDFATASEQKSRRERGLPSAVLPQPGDYGVVPAPSPYLIEDDTDDIEGEAAGSLNTITERLKADEERIATLEAKTSTGMDTLMSEIQNIDKAPKKSVPKPPQMKKDGE
ncbi:MAG: AAA family ATPase [Akkermansiaceae bacterium]|nr:AAA family ATPase [Armatimonadota bacterium]